MKTEPATENLVVSPHPLADGWSYWSPRPELALVHEINGPHEGGLVLRATGDRLAFGCWRGQARLEVGQWYRASVRAHIEDLEFPQLAIFAQVAQHFLVPAVSSPGDLLLERTFRHAKAEDGSDVELYLRAAERGSVEWYDPMVVKVEQPAKRSVRVATVRFGELPTAITREAHHSRIAEKLDAAGNLGADIVCLPEFSHSIGTEFDGKRSVELAEEAPTGPVCSLCAAKARQHRMYVIAGIVERRGPHLFNTAVLFGRDGEVIGRYDKTHLTFDELKWGISCGNSYPVFDLDFGRIGIHICYDEWFPEVSRLYAHNGVEILFLPVAGGKPITWRTRAMDNNVYFVSSSIVPPSMIIDSSGEIIAETHADGVVAAELDLDYRQVNWYKDPTLTYGMPCVAPQMRNVLDNELIEHLHSAMRGIIE